MSIFHYVTPLTYLALVGLWCFILGFFLHRLIVQRIESPLVRMLVLVLAIDAFRALFESAFFSFWNLSEIGWLPRAFHERLEQPHILFVPKGLHLLAALSIVFILLRRWLPDEAADLRALTARTRELQSLVERRTAELQRANAQLLEDVAERQRSEAALRQQREFEALVLRMSATFINLAPGEFDAGYQQALQAIGEFTDVDRSYLFLLSPDRARMSNTHEWCARGIEPQIHRLQNLPLDQFPWVRAHVIEQGEVTEVPSVADLPPEAPEKAEFVREGIQSLLLVPLRCGGHVVGFVGFDSVRRVKSWSRGDVTVLSIASEILAGAVASRRADESVRFIARLAASATGKDFFRSIVQHLGETLGVRHAFVGELIGPRNDRVRSLAYWMGGTFVEDYHYALKDTPCDNVVGKRACFYPRGAREAFPNDPDLARFNIEGYLGVPVFGAAGQPLGIVVIMHEQPMQDLFDAQSFIEVVAARVGAELERLRAEQELEMHRHHLEELVEQRTRELEASRGLLRQSERLASIGTLAAGLAHEINNPVGGILLAAQNAIEAQARPAAAPLVTACLGDIVRDAQRCGRIIESVLRFARQERSEKWPADLNAIIRLAAQHAEDYVAACGGEIQLALAGDLPPMPVNPLGIEQVFVNLIRNAAEASLGGVTVRIRTETTADGVRVTVQDNGRGIPRSLQEHLFDPFYTTRREKGGSGLGLSIVHGIITEHGGTIDVVSEEGRGTIFTVTFRATVLPATRAGDGENPDR